MSTNFLYPPGTLQNRGAHGAGLGRLGISVQHFQQRDNQSRQQEGMQQMRHTACCSIHASTLSHLVKNVKYRIHVVTVRQHLS